MFKSDLFKMILFNLPHFLQYLETKMVKILEYHFKSIWPSLFSYIHSPRSIYYLFVSQYVSLHNFRDSWYCKTERSSSLPHQVSWQWSQEVTFCSYAFSSLSNNIINKMPKDCKDCIQQIFLPGYNYYEEIFHYFLLRLLKYWVTGTWVSLPIVLFAYK